MCIEAVAKAVSLLNLKQEKNRISKRIQSLLQIADDMTPDSVEYECVYERILELKRMRELIRRIRRVIVYSPLNGTGLKPVTRTLKEMGYTNITVVKEQEQPDGNFPTCPYPNPEIKEAMALGMEYAKKCNADLLLATDPDCDRVGIAVKNKAGEYELLSGNQTGMLLLDYICSQRVKHDKMPAAPVMVKTIVTMDMGEQIATHYGHQRADRFQVHR